MNQSNSKSEKPKDQHRFNQQQYDMLKRCSDKKDMTEWNAWRDENDFIDIKLERADFSKWYLQKANFGTFREYGRRTAEVFLTGANFDNANLRGAKFQFSHLDGARFHEAHLEHANLMFAHLNKAFLLGIHLEDACLQCAELRNANVCNARLDRSNFIDSHLQGSEFDNACLICAKFRKVRVSSSTSFCYCEINRDTDFREVAIGGVQINSATKQLLEYNIRRMNWEAWYKYKNWQDNEDERNIVIQKPMWLIRLFWYFSDYGRSTGRIAAWFFGFAFVFAGVYCLFALKSPPGIVSNLLEGNEGLVPCWLVPFRAIYFSIITMTTLGFGDMYANAQSIWGHILLTIQVILGYVLLGALVTRFAVLFTAGGPAGKFANDND